jgi:hypothetical protein
VILATPAAKDKIGQSMCAEKSDLNLFICMLMYKKWDVPNKSQGPVQRALLFASELSNRKHKDCRSVQPIIAGKSSAQKQSKVGLEAQYESKKPLCHASLKMK